jgi:predicted phage tail protein
MREIRLNGALGKRYGRVHRFDVRTPAEAVRALIVNFPTLERELAESAVNGVSYLCRVDDEVADEEGIAAPMSRSFSITPVITGAEGAARAISGVFLSIIGGITMAYGFVTGNPALVAAGKMMAKIGMALMVSGVAQMLSPSVSAKEKDRVESDYFSGAQQTEVQGGPVPVGYGRLIVGSVTISAGITVEDKPIATTSADVPIGGFYGNLVNGAMS